MSNPAQPNFVFQIYSYDLEAYASLFAVRKACEPVHIQMNQDDFHVMVINQTPQLLRNLTAVTRVYNMDGRLKYARRIPIVAQPSAATDLGPINWPTGLSPVQFIKLMLEDPDHQVVSDNFYWRACRFIPTILRRCNPSPRFLLTPASRGTTRAEIA